MSWQNQRSMSPAEFAAVAGKLKLSQAAIGRYLGVSERTANRYMRGITAIPIPSALLLRALIHYKAKPVVPLWISPVGGRED